MRVLETGLPEEVGVDARGLERADSHLCNAVELGEIGAASLTVVRRGKVILERGYGLIYPAAGAPNVNAEGNRNEPIKKKLFNNFGIFFSTLLKLTSCKEFD